MTPPSLWPTFPAHPTLKDTCDGSLVLPLFSLCFLFFKYDDSQGSSQGMLLSERGFQGDWLPLVGTPRAPPALALVRLTGIGSALGSVGGNVCNTHSAPVSGTRTPDGCFSVPAAELGVVGLG